MKQSCIECGGYVCVDSGENSRTMARIGGGVVMNSVKGLVEGCPTRAININRRENVANMARSYRDFELRGLHPGSMPESEITRWFELEGKTDTLHLGC